VTKGKSRQSRRKDTAADRLEEQRERRQDEACIPLGRDEVPIQQPSNVLPLILKPPETDSVLTVTTLAEKLRLKKQEMLNGKL